MNLQEKFMKVFETSTYRNGFTFHDFEAVV